MRELNVLWISRYVAYDTVRHAGGQNFNFYLKRMSKENIKISMLAFCTPEERNKIDAEKYGINAYVYSVEEEYSSIRQKYNNFNMRYSPLNKHGNFCDNYAFNKVKTFVKRIPKEDWPDIVILHWTEMALLASEIKKLIPRVRIVVIEEDVAFLGVQRSAKAAKSKLIQKLKLLKYQKLKKEELKQLAYADVVFTTNHKDEALLNKYGIKSVKALSSYYHSLCNITRNSVFSYKIIFYGAMNREENYKAAIWFIENVFYRINDKWEFYIIGNKPAQDLLRYDSDRVHVTGFVEDIVPFFEDASCFVAPLLTGAGIKIKILEAMSSGIPVLTNDIGIEGIPAVDKDSYYHCNTAEDYILVLNQMVENYKNVFEVGIKGKQVIDSNFNYEKSFVEFRNTVMNQ